VFWSSQHPVVAPLAGNAIPHALRQSGPVVAVGVATRVPPQVETLPVEAAQVSGMTKVAVTFRSAVREGAQVPVPEQPPPDQPANSDPPEGVAVSVTVPLPLGNSAEHVAPQVMPVGADATVPVPPPARVTVTA